MLKNIFVLGVVIILAGVVFVYGSKDKVEPLTPLDLNQTSFTGEFVCLPHKNTDGPQTMECAFGLKADDGNYFALDFSTSTDPMNQPMNTPITVKGPVTPIEAISSNLGQIYNIRGIIRVEAIENKVSN
jgi:hypothetical protein